MTTRVCKCKDDCHPAASTEQMLTRAWSTRSQDDKSENPDGRLIAPNGFVKERYLGGIDFQPPRHFPARPASVSAIVPAAKVSLVLSLTLNLPLLQLFSPWFYTPPANIFTETPMEMAVCSVRSLPSCAYRIRQLLTETIQIHLFLSLSSLASQKDDAISIDAFSSL